MCRTNKQAEREQLRERALLKEFEEYKASTQRKLKLFRTEAIRAGFKACWQERDYATIVTISDKLPDAVLQEDEKPSKKSKRSTNERQCQVSENRRMVG